MLTAKMFVFSHSVFLTGPRSLDADSDSDFWEEPAQNMFWKVTGTGTEITLYVNQWTSSATCVQSTHLCKYTAKAQSMGVGSGARTWDFLRLASMFDDINCWENTKVQAVGTSNGRIRTINWRSGSRLSERRRNSVSDGIQAGHRETNCFPVTSEQVPSGGAHARHTTCRISVQETQCESTRITSTGRLVANPTTENPSMHAS